MKRGAFTLIELLVTVALAGVLTAMLLPALSGAREAARSAACLSRVRQLGLAWGMYAGDHDGRAMPLAYTSASDIGTGDPVYWFGRVGAGGVDHGGGILTPYLEAGPGEGSAFECPSQSWGTYEPQAGTSGPTTTYGYNGYYLSPPKTPGWGDQPWSPIHRRPWRRVSQVERPESVAVFADTLLPVGVSGRSVALLDPPRLFDGRRWRPNPSPTTCFRHVGGRAAVSRADGSCEAMSPGAGVAPDRYRVASLGADPGPHHVPDWERW